jgi:hypothetical protein
LQVMPDLSVKLATDLRLNRCRMLLIHDHTPHMLRNSGHKRVTERFPLLATHVWP